MEHQKIQMPDPFQPYGPNPMTLESINVRERHALFDEDSRYRRELIRIGTEHQDAVDLIKAAFNKDREDLINRQFAERAA